MKCQHADCQRRRTFPDQPFCNDHRLRWAPGESPAPRQPEWLRRMQERGLPAKDFTAA